MKKILFFVLVLSVCFVGTVQATTTVTVDEERTDYTDDQKRTFAGYCGVRQYKPYEEKWNNGNIGEYCQPFPNTIVLNETKTAIEKLKMHDETEVIFTWLHPNLFRAKWEDAFWFVCKGKDYLSDNFEGLSSCIATIQTKHPI